MATPASVKGPIDDAHWAAGQVIREGHIREDILQNLQYLLDSVLDLVGASFWELYAQQHQVGDVLGSPFA